MKAPDASGNKELGVPLNWKSPPDDPGKLWINKSLEIQTSLVCNWSCHACDQFSQLTSVSFVKKGTMTLDQIAFFIGELKAHNAYIGRIRMVGGEPTIHPKFAEIVNMIYADAIIPGYVSRLEVITNGSHMEKFTPEVRSHLAKIRVSGESAKQKHHTANLRNTPQELGYEGKMCNQPWHCGMSLNNWGYFPCSSGAGVIRLRDLQGWQKLTLPLCVKPCNAVRENWPQLQSLCNLCYHGLRPEDKVKCGSGLLPGQDQLNLPGPEIKPHLDQWLHGKPVEWQVYGTAT